MIVRDKPMTKFVLSQLIFLVIGSLLLTGGMFMVLRQPSNWLSGGALGILGACALFIAIKIGIEVFRGKTMLEQVALLALPGRAVCELIVPTPMSKGKVILFFEDTTERYAGRVTLVKVPDTGTCQVSVTLPRIEPSRIKIPRWVPTSDAGENFENWPRRTGASADPIVLKFAFPVQAGEILRLEFELESNFKGTKLERRFPITGTETIRAILKTDV